MKGRLERIVNFVLIGFGPAASDLGSVCTGTLCTRVSLALQGRLLFGATPRLFPHPSHFGFHAGARFEEP